MTNEKETEELKKKIPAVLDAEYKKSHSMAIKRGKAMKKLQREEQKKSSQ